MTTKLLVIEDNKPNLELMVYLLNAFGYDPTKAIDGETAIKLVAQETFDLIVCDIQLPGIDGFGLVRQFKSDPRLTDIPVVAVSALAMVGDRERILGAGFDGYIPKPIMPDTFVSKLEEYLPSEKRVTRPSAVAHSHNTTTSPEYASHKATVMVVDDQPSNLDVLRSTLEPSGYGVVTASSGQEARQTLERQQPDLILSDLHMPGELDFDFIEQVKADERFRSIPFVFISSTTRQERIRQKGMRLGAVRFIFRPVSPQVLLTEITTCLAQGKATSWPPYLWLTTALRIDSF